MSDHYVQCPLSPDFEFSDKEASRIDPYDVKTLVEAVDFGTSGVIRRALKPFAWMLDCQCAEIGQAYKEKAAEERAER